MAVESGQLAIDQGALVEIAPSRRRSKWRSSIQLWACVGVLLLIVFFCFIWPYIFPVPNPDATPATGALPLFSPGHILGTDDIGRDMLSRTLYGGRVSIEVGLSSVAIGFAIGGTLGLVSGYVGGKTDAVISRFLDLFLAFPALVLALAVAAYLGPNERDEIFAIAFFTIPVYGRYTRAATLRLREEGFLAASRILGARTSYILFRHVLPNIFGALITFGLVTIAGAVLAEAGLSFLGAGIRPPEASWGNMIAEGQQYLSNAPHIFLVPSVFLFVTILAFNYLGDVIRERLNV
jgi:peptide/nickel transport system permease protein